MSLLKPVRRLIRAARHETPLQQIYLVRHGESMGNTHEVDPWQVDNYSIALTGNGQEQSLSQGRAIGREHFLASSIYCSPYLRAVDTLSGMLHGVGLDRYDVRINEDPLLREIDLGKAPVPKDLVGKQAYFYFRPDGGESPADCCLRIDAFLSTMMRDVEQNETSNVVIVSHGLTIRCFIMRFLRLTVEQFLAMKNPDNCQQITIQRRTQFDNPALISRSRRWGVEGLQLRSSAASELPYWPPLAQTDSLSLRF